MPGIKFNTPLPLFALAAAASFYCTRKLDEEVWPTTPILTAYVSLAYWVIWRGWLYPIYFSSLRHVPTVPGFPLWGQFIPIIFEECGIPQRRWHRQHGPIIRYFFPFGCERLSIANDTSIRHLTVKNPYNFPKPVRAKLWMVRILGEGVLLAEGADHVYQRKTLTPGFSISAIRTFTPVFWEKALLMADLQRRQLDVTGKSSAPLEVLEWLNRCTLDIIGMAGFGYDIDSLREAALPLRHAYRLVFNFDLASRILHGAQAFFPSTKHIPAQMNRDMETARGIIMDEATRIIKDKLEEAERVPTAKDILALIAQENLKLKAKGEAGLSFETMRDQIMTFLGAGHDTTATGVTWTIHLLSIHPQVQTRLRDEIREHMPFLFDPDWTYDRSMTLTDPDRLPYLDNVCRESLRYIPPIPMTVRQSVADDVIDGYKVPAGTVVYMLANAINRMEWFWGDDADTFDPDRWDKLPETAVPNAFMTFLQGPRGCLGRKFAEVEMKVLLCVLLSRWEFSRDYTAEDPEDWKMWRLVLRPRNGLAVVAKPVIMPTETPPDSPALPPDEPPTDPTCRYRSPDNDDDNDNDNHLMNEEFFDQPSYVVAPTPCNTPAEQSPTSTPEESPINTPPETPAETPPASPADAPPETTHVDNNRAPETHVQPPVERPEGGELRRERGARPGARRAPFPVRAFRLLAILPRLMAPGNRILVWLRHRRLQL
ncbi:hypothetical protein MYCTH_2296119 [Thermothelomyces thermophilus ATCC 42464]|uniref:Cytochrome P450 n=1 Tax=Thermothelomyces thermophilus (strain ATCC 42464 / BCRC 31852 / DSM 1799) TaxID=573729 RepID=G2Q0I3_THET4|nr:uncharacterized protein MYCTH_2296119 [Thermothelomyces thermophilus ATCC 42464]AEO54044.1 hypothetical protein MYCTH_2296119 [Thermothelomyces thermophilus ATCC 42464]